VAGLHILLVDDHALFRRGLRMMLAELMPQAQLQEAESCEALSRFEGLSFDVVLLDLNMPDTGVGELRALEIAKARFPSSRVLVVSGEEQPSLIRAAIEKGAVGFLPKTVSPEIMMGALHIVLSGGVYVPEQVVVAPDAGASVLDRLTERQRSVLRMALKGTPNKMIGRELDLSEGTVKSHLSAAFRTMDVRNRTEALYAVAKLGWRV
jgi:DNA-binding NarL/FixJ family response regulator